MEIYKICGIYGIQNTINGKIYVGKTQQTFGDRWDEHRCKLRNNYHDNKHLQNAWNKYGEESFEFIILEVIDDKQNNELYNEREKYWISQFKQDDLAYNITDGGDGAPGNHLSDGAKRKIGEKNRINGLGRKVDQKTKDKMSKSHRLRWNSLTEEQKEAFRQACKGNNKGHSVSEEQRQRIRATLQKNPTRRKYTDDQIKEVRMRSLLLSQTNKQISQDMHIPPNYVSAILKNKRWPLLIPTEQDKENFINTYMTTQCQTSNVEEGQTTIS